MSDIEWVDEPPITETDPKGRHFAFAAELRARPGQWALISQGVSPGLAGNLRNAKAYQPSTDYQITMRKHDGDPTKRDIYARFIGEAS